MIDVSDITVAIHCLLHSVDMGEKRKPENSRLVDISTAAMLAMLSETNGPTPISPPLPLIADDMSNVSAVAVISGDSGTDNSDGGQIATAADALMFQLRYITLTHEAYRYRFRAKNWYIVSV